MNSVNLLGRLTREPEVRTTQNGKTMAKFSLAIRRDADNTDFINCVAFGKNAELVEKYVDKGHQLGVTGSIKTGSYEKDGRKVYTTDILVERVTFVGGEKKESAPKGFAAMDDDDFDMPWA